MDLFIAFGIVSRALSRFFLILSSLLLLKHFIGWKPVDECLHVHVQILSSFGQSLFNCGRKFIAELVIAVCVSVGFLSNGDSEAPGNFALLDLTAALRWVQENIESFGGSRKHVTLMGHGAGAVLVNLLTLSPVVTGFICRIIIIIRLRNSRN